jgi:hypothetical protein
VEKRDKAGGMMACSIGSLDVFVDMSCMCSWRADSAFSVKRPTYPHPPQPQLIRTPAVNQVLRILTASAQICLAYTRASPTPTSPSVTAA